MTRLLQIHALVSTPIIAALSVAALSNLWTAPPENPPVTRFEELTVGRLIVVDAAGRTRVILAGGFPPRRAASAGLIFNNEDGHEAGGLTYIGKKDADGKIEAGGLLTFDQFRNDQILALEYSQSADQKYTGLTVTDRPDELSPLVLEFYGKLERATSAEERAGIRKEYEPRIPADQMMARRVFVGRATDGAAVLILRDPAGKPRLKLEVNSLGQPSIAFLDADGQVVRSVTP